MSSAGLDDNTAYRLALRATALAYVAKGWRVIPLAQVTYDGEGNKHIRPLIKWQREPASVVTTPEQVERWFGLTGQAQGLAIATGAVLAVDLDEYKAGYAGVELPAGGWQEVHAGRGGGHVYLANPDGQRNTAGAHGSGVDTRGDGGLSVAAPTRCLHPDGRVTQWQTVRPVGELPHPATLPPAPPLAVRAAQRERSAPGTVTPMTPEAAEFSVVRGRDAWLASRHGERHTALIKYLGTLVRYRLAQGAELSALIGELQDAADEHPDAQAGEEFESVDSAIGWAVEQARATPWRIGPPEGFAARFEPPGPGDAPAVTADVGDGGELFAGGDSDFYDNPAPPPQPVYGAFGGKFALFYDTGVHWLQGESESGKTWVGLEVVREVLSTGAWVIVVDHEDTRGSVLRRLKALGMTREDYRRLVYVSGPDVTHAELRAHLDTTERDYALMLVDGVTSALTAAGLSGRDEQELTRWVDQLPRRVRMSICIDHVVKAVDDRRGMAVGTQAKKSVVTGSSWEVVCTEQFGRGRDGRIELRPQKDKGGFLRGELGRNPVRLAFRSGEGGERVRLEAGAADDGGFFSNPDDALWGALFADGVDGGIGVNELAREAKERQCGYGNRLKAEKHRAWLQYYTERMSGAGPTPSGPVGTTSDQLSPFSEPTYGSS